MYGGGKKVGVQVPNVLSAADTGGKRGGGGAPSVGGGRYGLWSTKKMTV